MANTNSLIYPNYYQPYLDALKDLDSSVVEKLIFSLAEAKKLFKAIPKEKHGYRYAPDKWTVKDIVQHLTDTEMIFVYRALRFARNDRAVLHGFDENAYAQNAGADRSDFDDLTGGLYALRQSTISLYSGFDDSQIERTGKVGENVFSVRALGYIISGHLMHHLQVIEERYL